MSEHDMGRFWDERAKENAYFFVDDRLDYDSSDLEAFWADGVKTVDTILDALGLEVVGSDQVVEIGCGVGRLTQVLAARAERVWALDVSAEMIARAVEHHDALENVTWRRSDGVSLQPVQDGDASVVFSHVVFQHIPDPEITLGYVREMGRVLRPGGWAAFQISNDPAIHSGRRPGLRDRARAAVGRGPKGQDDPRWLGSAVDLDALRSVADAAGLDVERVEGEGTQFCLVALRR